MTLTTIRREHLMIQLIADDTKQFMNCLLRTDAFDQFLLYDMTLDVLHRFEFSGEINASYLSSDEQALYEGQRYINWLSLKPQITAILTQSHTPSNMKITMSLSKTATLDIQQRLLGESTTYPVQGFLINLTFDGKRVIVTTGVNYSQFILDKSIEKAFDRMIEKFFKKHEVLMVTG